jgi:hypothetical protein
MLFGPNLRIHRQPKGVEVMRKIRLISIVTVLLCCSVLQGAEAIKHKFLVMDEGCHEIHYVDQTNPKNDWTLRHKGRGWDMQLLDDKRLAVNTGGGWVIYDLKTRKLLEEHSDKNLKGVISMRWTSDGTKYLLANNKGITLYKLNKADKIVASKNYPKLKTARYVRLAPDGNPIFASSDGLTEVSKTDLSIVKRVLIPGGKQTKAFQGGKTARGNYLMGSGFAGAFYEITPDGNVVKEFTQKKADMPEGMVNRFYSGFTLLKNGHVICAHWAGHGRDAAKNAYQLMQFNKEGKIVWYWHDPKRAGCALQAIIMD